MARQSLQQVAGSNSQNIQAGRDVIISAGESASTKSAEPNTDGQDPDIKDLLGCVPLLLLGYIIYLTLSYSFSVIVFLWSTLNNYAALSVPYSFVAMFYYYTIVKPIEIFSIAAWSIWDHNLTVFPNLNLVIRLIGEALLLAVIVGSCVALFRCSQRTLMILAGAFLTPLTFALLWFIVNGATNWLFT